MSVVPLIIKIANVLAYIFLLGANVYSVAGPDTDDSPYAGDHPTFITPDIYAFGIWGIIHFLFLGFVVYQFFSAAHETVIEGIHWHFVSITLLNSLWLALWQTDHLILSWIVILFVASQVSYVYFTVRNKYPAQGFNDTLWIHGPFSLYHAWVLVIVVINTFAAFTQSAEEEDGEVPDPTLLTQILVALGLLFLQSTAIGYIDHYGKGDLAGSLVIAWTLFGISCNQQDLFIHWTALVLGVITTIYSVKPLVKRYLLGRNDESAPLLG